MPTYDYKCQTCNDSIELLLNILDIPKIPCDNCGGERIRGFGGGLGIHFKGDGFYETDYKGK